jgi:predicted lipid-binding transport protein (Tim44 family)
VPPEVQIVIFAVLAAIVLFQLYNVLGRRVGRQAEDLTETERERYAGRKGAAEDAREPAKIVRSPSVPGLDVLRAREPGFDPDAFVEGARTAYATVVRAFAAGDREMLKPLLAPAVAASFEAAMAKRDADGRTEQVEFLHPPRVDLEGLELSDDVARARVRFLTELRSRTKGPEGEAVDDRRTAEIWTFERPAGAADPNWKLARVEAAEA